MFLLRCLKSGTDGVILREITSLVLYSCHFVFFDILKTKKTVQISTIFIKTNELESELCKNVKLPEKTRIKTNLESNKIGLLKFCTC